VRIGIIGGSFNPVHLGHLYAARFALRKANLNEVWFLPAYLPPHKAKSQFVSAYHRFAMLSLATIKTKNFKILTFELDKSSICYTIDTINSLIQSFNDKNNHQFFFIMGSDSLLEIQTWKDYPKLLNLIFFIILERSNVSYNSLSSLPSWIKEKFTFNLNEMDLIRKNILLLKGKMPNISSSTIRNLIRENKDIGNLVPKSVIKYIQKYNLYKEVNHSQK
jgi:nicotinate-nucleotide adenylyltransferase